MSKLKFGLCASFIVLSFAAGQEQKPPLLVSTEWLAQHSSDPKLVIVHVANIRAEYKSGHIPGARFLWFASLTPSTPDESNTVPSCESAVKTLEELGVSNDSRIILYGGPGVVTSVARTYLMLEYLGLGANTSILDGGLDAWKAEKKQLSTSVESAPARGSLKVAEHPSLIVDGDWVRDNLKNPSVAVVDARAKNVYDGTPGSPQKTGHIGGAKNINLTSLVDSLNRFKSMEDLKKIFSEAGVMNGTKVVTYCTTGQLATVTYIAAKILGFDVSVYDGSWEDWSTRGDDFPVEVTPKKEKK